MSDHSDNSATWAAISDINEKIQDCHSAKSEVQMVKNDCSNKRTDWQTSYNTLANDQELSNVKKTDVFEGTMADGLKGKVADAMTQIRTGISESGNLESALNSQIAHMPMIRWGIEPQ